MKCPDSLIKQALLLGSSNNFVQGAGGNLSCKENGILWIKSSGTRLRDAATKPVFVPMDLKRTRDEVLSTEDLTHCCLPYPETNNYRPSIETAIHSLLPHKFVAHVHSLGAISKAISAKATEHLMELQINATKMYIPYSKPGIPLANSILQKLSESPLEDLQNLIVLLGNHGVIVASEEISEATNLILEIENKWNTLPPLSEKDKNTSQEWSMLFPPNSLNSYQVDLLSRGALTPDQLVFLGSTPFNYWKDKSVSSKACIKFDGSVWIRSDLGIDAIEIVSSFVHIARISSIEDSTVYLSNSDKYELENWDAEKWRKAQER